MITELFVISITIQRATQVSDSMGGFTPTWATSSTIKGRIRSLSGNEQTIYSRQTVVSSHRLYAPAGADILESDRVVYGSDTFDVQYVDQKMDGGGVVRFLQVDMVLRK